MYKVYFAVYLSSQKCGTFRNIRRFFVIYLRNSKIFIVLQ